MTVGHSHAMHGDGDRRQVRVLLPNINIRKEATGQVVCYANGRPVPPEGITPHANAMHSFFYFIRRFAQAQPPYKIKNNLKNFRLRVVEATGLEPVTSRM